MLFSSLMCPTCSNSRLKKGCGSKWRTTINKGTCHAHPTSAMLPIFLKWGVVPHWVNIGVWEPKGGPCVCWKRSMEVDGEHEKPPNLTSLAVHMRGMPHCMNPRQGKGVWATHSFHPKREERTTYSLSQRQHAFLGHTTSCSPSFILCTLSYCPKREERRKRKTVSHGNSCSSKIILQKSTLGQLTLRAS